MKYGLIGEHLKHSFSKDIHNRIASYDYRITEVPKSEIDEFFRKRNFKGINITIPYKQTVIPYLTYISERVKSIGAVNTVVNRDGLLYGYNTDFGGMQALILKNGIDIKGKKVLILGTGGTSKTAFAVANSLGAKNVIKVSRSGGSSAVSYEDVYLNHTDAQIIINTTPCGMFPDNYSSALDLSKFANLSGVVDAVYNPLCSKLVIDAKKMGIASCGGLYMLIAQAVFACEIFLETKLREGIIDEIYDDILKEKQNIVLVGMPSCGKSTVGKVLASDLKRKFVDTDELIAEKFGTDIPSIFALYGETAFRDAETEIIKEISKQSSVIISTGGGAVLRDENIDALRQNGKIVFIDRPLENLMPTSDRPLANDAEKIKKLYETRYPVYVSCADLTVNANGSVRSVADSIKERW